MGSPDQVAAPNFNDRIASFANSSVWPEVALALVVVLCFGATIGFGFVYDDRFMFGGHSANQNWHKLGNCFTTDRSGIYGSNFYRPVSCSVQNVGLALLDARPAGWHLLSLLLHLFNTLLVFRLAKLLLCDSTSALVAGALFAVHPVHLEAVAWISASNDLLMTLFALTAAITWWHWLQKESWAWYAGALVACTAAVLCKEPAVGLPPVLLGLGLVSKPRRAARTVILATVPFFVVEIAYLIARHRVLHTALAPARQLNAAALSSAQMFFTIPSALWFYIKKLLLPSGSSFFYPLGTVETWSSAAFLVPLGLTLLAIIVTAWRIHRSEQSAQFWFAAAWTALFLGPMLYLRALMKYEIVQDRYLYAPSAGFCILAAVALLALGRALCLKRESAIPVLPALAIAIAFGVTILNISTFRDDVSVFTRAVAVAPTNPKALMNLGASLVERGDSANGIPLLERAVQISPTNPAALMDLGAALMQQKDYRRGIELLDRAVELDPSSAQAVYNRGRAAWELGDNVTAERYFSRALELSRRPEYLVQFVSVEMRLGKVTQAEAAAREALRLDPKVANGHLALGVVLLEKGDRAGAVEEFKSQLAVDPTNRGAQIGLQRLSSQ